MHTKFYAYFAPLMNIILQKPLRSGKMNKIFKYIITFCILFLTLSLVAFPQPCLDAAQAAVELCLSTVIPSLFPFFVCSGIFTALGLARLCSRTLSPLMRPLFNLPGSGALAFVLGIVSGYPLGAACAADLFRCGECTREEAERMTAFCNNSGPLFVIGVIGCGIMKTPKVGYYLYVAQILAALMTGIVFRFYKSAKSQHTAPELPPSPSVSVKSAAAAVGIAVDNAVSSILKVCAFVILFSVAAATLPQTNLTPFIYALMEITGGINAVAAVNIDFVLKMALISFFLTLSGISVIFQVSSVICPHGMSLVPYILGKLISAVFAFGIAYFLFTYFPITEDAFSSGAELVKTAFSPLSVFTASAASIFFGGVICMLLAAIPSAAKYLKTSR